MVELARLVDQVVAVVNRTLPNMVGTDADGPPRVGVWLEEARIANGGAITGGVEPFEDLHTARPVTSSQIQSNPVKSSQLNSTQLNSTQLNSRQVKAFKELRRSA